MARPKKRKQKPKKMLADRRTTKASTGNRVARGKLLTNVGAKSPLWTGAIQSTGNDVIAAGTKVEADDARVQQLELQLQAAKDDKVHDEQIFDSKFEVYVTTVEDTVTTPKEMQDLALDPLTGKVFTLAAPLGLTATSDPATRDISVHVKRAPGMRRCDIEISQDLTMQTGVKLFPGDGLRQKMGPFAPGTYAVRARHTRASERSPYTDIVNVIVK
jgi:hypothetical protein